MTALARPQILPLSQQLPGPSRALHPQDRARPCPVPSGRQWGCGVYQAPHSHLPKGWEEGGQQIPRRRELLTTPGQQLPSLGPSPGRPRDSLGNLSALWGWAGGPLPAASLPGAGLCPNRGSPAAGSRALLRTQRPGMQGHGAEGQRWACVGPPPSCTPPQLSRSGSRNSVFLSGVMLP